MVDWKILPSTGKYKVKMTGWLLIFPIIEIKILSWKRAAQQDFAAFLVEFFYDVSKGFGIKRPAVVGDFLFPFVNKHSCSLRQSATNLDTNLSTVWLSKWPKIDTKPRWSTLQIHRSHIDTILLKWTDKQTNMQLRDINCAPPTDKSKYLRLNKIRPTFQTGWLG